MLKLKYLVYGLCLFIGVQSVYAQLGFSNELGIIAGPLQFRSDFGIRDDSKTNFGNSGFGVGIVHYINFAYRADSNIYRTNTFFNDHFKVRNEISYNKTTLEHLGKWVDPDKDTPAASQLRGHKGVAENIDIGTQVEFFPLSIRSFQAFGYRFAPFASLGLHYTYFTPGVSTNYANPDPAAVGDVTDPSNFYNDWAPGSVDASPGSTLSFVAGVGVRYKLDQFSDLILNLRFQYYFSDWVDGLNHQLKSNKNNDWLVWVNFGYIYYLNY